MGSPLLEIDQRREEMIWRVVSRYAELAGMTLTTSPGVAYAIFDRLFQQALLHQLAGREDAGSELAANVARVLDTVTARPRGPGLRTLLCWTPWPAAEPAGTVHAIPWCNYIFTHAGCKCRAAAGSVDVWRAARIRTRMPSGMAVP